MTENAHFFISRYCSAYRLVYVYVRPANHKIVISFRLISLEERIAADVRFAFKLDNIHTFDDVVEGCKKNGIVVQTIEYVSEKGRMVGQYRELTTEERIELLLPQPAGENTHD